MLVESLPRSAQWRSGPEYFEGRRRAIERRFAFLCRHFTPLTVFMQLDPGDCALALRAASYVERVYAVGVPEQIMRSLRPPANLRLVRSDGISVPVPAGSVHVAASDQPIDKARQSGLHRALAAGGIYFCWLSGKTHRLSELRRMFREAGFSSLSFHPFLLAPWSDSIRIAARK